MISRRDFLRAGAALGTVASIGSARAASTKSLGRVMVIGAGYGGATAAKYLRLWSRGAIEVLLVDRDPLFVSCPCSNLVLGGSRSMAEISFPRTKLRDHGLQLLFDEVVSIDPVKRVAKFKERYADLSYDRLVVSPGIDFMVEAVPGLKNPEAQKRFLHAWKAGAQTVAVRARLEAMRDGGVFVISVPRAPYRCAA